MRNRVETGWRGTLLVGENKNDICLGVLMMTDAGVSIFCTTRGNLSLKPEESTTQSSGFVLTPGWLSSLSVSLDYYDIEIQPDLRRRHAQLGRARQLHVRTTTSSLRGTR